MEWDQVVAKVLPYLVRIDMQDSGGSGFLCLYNDGRNWAGIATAAHVVSAAEEWNLPIKITCQATGESKLLGASDRVIVLDGQTDSAVILLKNNLGLHQDTIPLLPASVTLPIGASVGWLGYPAIARTTHCFFSGCVSAVENVHPRSYLIDGEAINGVRGGAVFYHSTEKNTTLIVGVLTAYVANRTFGESLPGLSVARDVSHFHKVVQTVKSLDEAEKKKAQLAAAAQSELSQPTTSVLPIR